MRTADIGTRRQRLPAAAAEGQRRCCEGQHKQQGEDTQRDSQAEKSSHSIIL
jgi:hypothetical protein